ncbi:carboxypeptidase-like regulatory domain-containing protein [Mucilaginibacter xinganensis]|uniref:CarboxypepD_reg-like domain-containing protein n=1 Tax=Mucilaginibacter xinganensis TaxID=1234841 RepID=A0A223NRW9_9SPHI|nr:carboxypeptidase-like regulatory domain-containing protein [Mucilaginibacter xinganensis]ASU32241.1 hypothetical protein MuYL_0338 [Mucilaginibacter xinganensis]
MKWGLFFCFLFLTVRCFSQDKTVAGIVFDKESKDRIATVSIHNITTGASAYDNLKGEFKIVAKPGDTLVFSRLEYFPDTVKIRSGAELAVYMKRSAIQLKEVTVRDSAISPEQRLELMKRDYPQIYGSLAYNDFLTSPSSGGAGLSIDALWNALSRSGRNAEKLRGTIERDYEQNSIDYRFNRTYVGKITGLKDEKLTAFMFRYRPGYYTTKTANEYEFVAMIRANLRRFLRNQRSYNLPTLVTPPVVN